MPHVEAAMVALSKENVSSVWTHARESSTLINGSSVINQFTRSKFLSLWIEGLAIEVVFDFLESANDLCFMCRGVGKLKMSGTIEECLAIWRPSREAFKFERVVFDDAHFILFHIVEDDVAS